MPPHDEKGPASFDGLYEPVMAVDRIALRGFAAARRASGPCASIAWDANGMAVRGSVALVRIEGPLMRSSWYWDSYEAIADRFTKAQASEAKKVLVYVHSPGGQISGLDECFTAMLAAKQKYGKPVEIIAADMAYSAAYWLAMIGDKVRVTRTGGVGNVGVRTTLLDYSKMNEDIGLRVEIVSSGEQKADGDPDKPLTDAVIQRFQGQVDYLAGLFWEAVARGRGMTIEQVRAQEAGVFLGPAAVEARLADGVATVEEAIAALENQVSGRTVVALSGRTAQSQQERKGMDNTVLALALGIAATASDQDITERLTALRNVESKLREATGKASTGEALAVVDGWKENSGKFATMAKELADLRAVEDKREYEATFKLAWDAGKITPANEANVRARYTDSAALKAWADTALSGVPGASNAGDKQAAKKADEKPETGAKTWQGKSWAQLTYSERAALHKADSALYAEMKEGR